LRAVLTDAGYLVERVLRAGFPTFNLYKLGVIVRGKRLITDMQQHNVPGEGLMRLVFGFGFKHTLDNAPFGWQMAAIATVPADRP
jgi:hypothetical protein